MRRGRRSLFGSGLCAFLLVACSATPPAQTAPAQTATAETSPVAPAPPSTASAASFQPSPGASLALTPPTLPAVDDAIPAAMDTEVALVHDLRREAGIAALVGTDGEQALAAIDDAQAEYAETEFPGLVDQLAVGTSAAPGQIASVGGSSVQASNAFQEWTPTYSGRTAYTASMMTALLAQSIGSADTDRPRSTVTSKETSQRTAGDVRESITLQTTMTLQTGAGRITGEIELMTTTQATSVSTGASIGSLGAAANGHIEVNACPDADGVAEGNINMLWLEQIATPGRADAGASASFDAEIRMLDGEDARLVQTELDMNYAKGAHGPGTPGGDPGAPFDWSFQGSMSVVVPRSGQVSVPSVSGEGNGATDAQAAGAATYALTQASLIVFQIAEQAERFWRGGKCVDVRTSEGSRQVDPDEELTITVEAAHKFDGASIDGKAETSFIGVQEIRPTAPIDTPGELTFVAGPDPGDEGTLEVKHTSKRGIGTKSLTFTVGGAYSISLDGRMSIDQANSSSFTLSEQELLRQDDGAFALETEVAVSGSAGFPGCTREFSHQLPVRIEVRPADTDPPTANLRVLPIGGSTLLRIEITCNGATTLAPVPLDLWAISFNTLTRPGVTVQVDEPTTVVGEAAAAAGAEITTTVNLTTGTQ